MNSQSDTMIVRRAEEKDMPALEAFYRLHHPGRSRLHDMALWRWEFIDNPNIGEEIPFFILECDGELAGGIGYVPVRLRVGDRMLRAGHPVNFFIDERYRGLPALRLLRAVLNDCPVAFSSYVSDDAAKLLKAAGFIDLSEQLARYYLPLRRGGRQHGRRGGIFRVRSAGIHVLRRLLEQAIRGYFGLTGRKYHSESAKALPDVILESLVTDDVRMQCGIIKDKAYIRWRYAQSPALDCLYVHVWRGGVPLALAIVHLNLEEKRAVLLDVVRCSSSFFPVQRLLLAVIQACREAGADVLSTVVTSGEITKAMKLLGFSRMPSDYRFLVFARDRELKKELTGPGKWHFILGDTDRY